jgi:hypothetical protein
MKGSSEQFRAYSDPMILIGQSPIRTELKHHGRKILNLCVLNRQDEIVHEQK